MALPIAINGALGKMGIEIAHLVLSNPDLRLCAAIDRQGHPRCGEDYGACVGRSDIGIPVTDVITREVVDKNVIIDFSSPQSTRRLLFNAKNGTPRLVIGTTGLGEDEFAIAREISERAPVLVSPNMSLGVNLLFWLTEQVSSRLKNDFDIEIVEAHHRYKRDAPSGTARRLGEIVSAAYGLPYAEAVKDGRSGMMTQDRPKNEVGMHALRGGDIVGDHTVLFAGIGERLELRHMAHSRSTLARGAVAAAIWLSSREKGYYSMRDVLGI
ncbi:MAG: 4-hydroxy-tetrahydrodipicolinate reductase [Chitinispirillaceae bacterium]|nr:4-hydroxy-tetrahydrodipicolinate reductase [Chitinispirillaceae bacterium]